jgi:hypothetical protein
MVCELELRAAHEPRTFCTPCVLCSISSTNIHSVDNYNYNYV